MYHSASRAKRHAGDRRLQRGVRPRSPAPPYFHARLSFLPDEAHSFRYRLIRL
jgi:hypothetical protein